MASNKIVNRKKEFNSRLKKKKFDIVRTSLVGPSIYKHFVEIIPESYLINFILTVKFTVYVKMPKTLV